MAACQKCGWHARLSSGRRTRGNIKWHNTWQSPGGKRAGILGSAVLPGGLPRSKEPQAWQPMRVWVARQAVVRPAHTWHSQVAEHLAKSGWQTCWHSCCRSFCQGRCHEVRRPTGGKISQSLARNFTECHHYATCHMQNPIAKVPPDFIVSGPVSPASCHSHRAALPTPLSKNHCTKRAAAHPQQAGGGSPRWPGRPW
jgi:hypothetical protein